MDPDLRAHLAAHLGRLDALAARGRHLSARLGNDPTDAPALAAMRVWQQDCAAAVNQLSGGTKAHWLARAYGDAFLVRSTTAAAPAEIVARVVGVLEQAVASLSEMGRTEAEASAHEYASAASDSAVVGRSFSFGFVHNEQLRPVLQQAYADSRHAMEERDNRRALMDACGIMEAIVTDALEHRGLPPIEISGWTFDQRLDAAQAAGLIRGGTARLPQVARRYREAPPDAVSERDARVTQQVLHVLMRDLDPGR